MSEYPSPAAVLVDSSGAVVDVPVDGNLYFVAVQDPEQIDIQRKMLSELRKMNHYLAEMVGYKLSDRDLEES